MQINLACQSPTCRRAMFNSDQVFALELTGVTKPVADFIEALRIGIIDGYEYHTAQQCQVPEFDCHVLLTRLRPVLVSTPTEEFFIRSQDPDHRGSLASLRCHSRIFPGQITRLGSTRPATVSSPTLRCILADLWTRTNWHGADKNIGMLALATSMFGTRHE